MCGGGSNPDSQAGLLLLSRKRDGLSVQGPQWHSCLSVSNPPVYQLLAVVAVHHAKLAERLGAAVVVVRIPQVLPCRCQVLPALCVDEKHFEHLPGAYTLLDLHHSTTRQSATAATMRQAACGLCVALTSSWYTKEVPGATRPSSSCILGLLRLCCGACRPLLLLLLLLLPPQQSTKQLGLGQQ